MNRKQPARATNERDELAQTISNFTCFLNGSGRIGTCYDLQPCYACVPRLGGRYHSREERKVALESHPQQAPRRPSPKCWLQPLRSSIQVRSERFFCRSFRKNRQRNVASSSQAGPTGDSSPSVWRSKPHFDPHSRPPATGTNDKDTFPLARKAATTEYFNKVLKRDRREQSTSNDHARLAHFSSAFASKTSPSFVSGKVSSSS